jgi:hypothetical protein
MPCSRWLIACVDHPDAAFVIDVGKLAHNALEVLRSYYNIVCGKQHYAIAFFTVEQNNLTINVPAKSDRRALLVYKGK